MARRAQRRWRWRAPLLLAALAIASWLFGLFLFIERIPRAAANDRIADAVVVLTGGPGRIERGAHLLKERKAGRMLISGVGADVRARDLLSQREVPDALLACCVTLGRAAQDTHENAIETAGWAASQSISSIRLVTADFHMPRSMLEFEAGLRGIEILPEPVSSENIQLDQWWQRPATAILLAGEYTKYLAARAQMALTGFFNLSR
ncbi:MAG: YdcF family protein [Alphaproteobacteria bacterium]|nr:YdcF family protein [Alphaproteobacteria bacterium]